MLEQPSIYGALAQLVEHRAFNPLVVGAIPTRPTFIRFRNPNNINYLV